MADGLSFGGDEPVRVAQRLERRGRGVLASRHIHEGEVIFRDTPFLVSVAEDAKSEFCAHCFRSLVHPSNSSKNDSNANPVETCQAVRCDACEECWYCNENCLTEASKSSHPPYMCKTLALLPHSRMTDESKSTARFVLSAYNLIAFETPSNGGPSPCNSYSEVSSTISQSKFDWILNLAYDDSDTELEENAVQIHIFVARNLLPQSPPSKIVDLLSLRMTSRLISIDERNSFGMMAPFTPGGERKLRGSCIYLRSSMLNHDCIPNACRYDYIDTPSPNNLELQIRALRNIKEGEEVCISYFPINWSIDDRKKRLLDDYGFDCICQRCKIESQWSSDEEEEEEDEIDQEGENIRRDDEGEEEATVEIQHPTHKRDGGTDDDDDGEEGNIDPPESDSTIKSGKGKQPSSGNESATAEFKEEDGIDEDELMMFFVKYVCPEEGCGGTMCATQGVWNQPQQYEPSDSMECNLCGRLRSNDEFMHDLMSNGIMQS